MKNLLIRTTLFGLCGVSLFSFESYSHAQSIAASSIATDKSTVVRHTLADDESNTGGKPGIITPGEGGGQVFGAANSSSGAGGGFGDGSGNGWGSGGGNVNNAGNGGDGGGHQFHWF